MNTKMITNKFLLTQVKVEKLGTDNIQDAFAAVLKISKDVKSLIDNWNMGDAFSLLLSLAKFNGLIPVFKQAVKEYKDLDKTEIEGLRLFLKDEIDLENNDLEKVIEEGIDIIAEGYELISGAVQFYIKIKGFVPRFKQATGEKTLTARIRT